MASNCSSPTETTPAPSGCPGAASPPPTPRRPAGVYAWLRRWALFGGRRRMAGGAQGWVLELGMGAGANLPHYRGPACVVGLDTRPAALQVAAAEALAVAFPVGLVCARAEALPFPDHSFDAVVTALVLCSVADPAAALAEARRVLRPGGELRLVEHVMPARGPMRALVTWVLPLWNRISHECRLDRDTLTALREAGFTVRELGTHVGGLFVEVVAHAS